MITYGGAAGCRACPGEHPSLRGRLVRAGGLEPPRAFGPTDFRTSYGLRRRRPRARLRGPRLWSGLSLHPGVAALGAARLVSTPSRFRAWLGIATRMVPPNLGSSASPVSRRALKSPQVRCVYRFRHARAAARCIADDGSPPSHPVTIVFKARSTVFHKI